MTEETRREQPAGTAEKENNTAMTAVKRRSWTGGITGGVKNALEGLRCGLAPMLGKEMRGRTRGWRAPVLLSVYLGVLTACVLLFLWFNLERMPFINPQVGLSLYTLFIFILIMLISFIAPAVAAGAISGERERRTYDLLLVTRASITGIVLGKWLASVAYLIFLAVSALPVFAVVFFFGGVPPATFGLAFVVCLAAGLGYGALGLALSALTRRSQAATIISLVLVFVFIFGIPVISGIVLAGSQAGQVQMPQETPGAAFAGSPWYLFFSPLTAFTSVLPGSGDYNPRGDIPIISELMNMLLRGNGTGGIDKRAFAHGYSYPAYAGGEPEIKPPGMAAWAPWARFTLYQGFLILFSLTTAVLAITPRNPRAAWRVWKARRQAARG